ncbi:acetoacetyl-CoA reductase [Candidatus Persebacteraceae bacterium Df01]|jgi:acetoacetyl-CoA reductase|uniref:Acetoacetyl-CoA reductase n=1 Tax=Candidatus Doriopsillibacter californiensis TaxID=2970740 RepID=A0ABT7QMH0_9GAMM|nr:acetoacetyl-CoA reductase [Candidatus Persebacteraceae bacterium Df01]
MAKTALVTGGLGGIGTAICRQLHCDGYTVAATYIHNGVRLQSWLEKQKADGFDSFHGYFCDISQWESCAKLKEAVEADLGGVDILVNNGGITRDATFRKMTAEMWDEVIVTNLSSVFYVSRQFVPDMANRGFGRVVNISSVNAQKGQFGQTNYSAAKAGMHGFTKALAQEVVSKGVTINTISPGYIGTDMVNNIAEEVREKIRAQIPVGRFGTPEEIASVVSFLASENAAFITGANIAANGGQHMY